MEQVRCTNCGSSAVIPDNSGEFCKCEACGSTFNVPRAVAFSKVTLDRSQDVRLWREYLAKQLRLQQESNKARDYGGVKLFAQKILSVLPDDFCAGFYCALADRYAENDTAFIDFVTNTSLNGVTPEELKEVTAALVASVEPKYVDAVKAFTARAYPQSCEAYDAAIDRNIKQYIQKLRYAKATDRDVFICHRTAAPDQDIADAICTRLEERGLRCWIAPRNILAGSQNYERDILKGVENSRLFLLVSSFKSIYSEDCEKELKAAVLESKALYSYRIDDTPYDGAFEKALANVQWLDAQDDPYAHLEQLVIDVKGMLARDEREKVELEEKRYMAREKERLLAEERRNKEQARLDRLERIVSGETAATAAPMTQAMRSKLKRAEIEIQSKDYDRACKIADEVLDNDPECAHAWWLLMLCDMRMPDDECLLKGGEDFTAHRYYRNAERFAYHDPVFERRLDNAVTELKTRTVKEVTARLDEAERLFKAENYTAMNEQVARCAHSFDEENGLMFTRFADVASRYYWLKLWAKYGQNPLVCVEDVTRESEYGNALKYASPAQKAEYEKACKTIAKNAENFLRERSKNPANDGKLVDYLADNRRILPVDVYNYYASTLYFRKMLSALKMTEAQLRASTVDVTANEYFMLAQSLATAEQAKEYDDLVRATEQNRAEQKRREDEDRARREKMKSRDEVRARRYKTATKVCLAVFASLEYIFAIAAIAALDVEGFNGKSNKFASFLLVCSAFRLITSAFALKSESPASAVIAHADIILNGFSIAACFTPFIRGASYGLIVVNVILCINCFITGGIKISRFKKQSGK